MLGQVREHVMPIFTGTGANGKGTFRDAVLHAFGDYAHEVGPELLMESKHPRHGTFKMQLRGRRLVFCSETQQGARFDAETMKRLVGGDPIEANLMRRDPITFLPSHTLIMLTNHLPVISGEDEAVWRRVLVVPFHVVIPEDERDPGLSQELKAAAPAVMAWAATGWREYQRIGLSAPDAVRASTDAYREDSDQLGRFLADRCFPGPRMQVGARDLFHAYSTWCSAVGERTVGEKDFAKSMAAKGMEKRKTGSGLRYWGVGLEDDTPEGDTPGRDR
jgi:putative DNA primase/helicase